MIFNPHSKSPFPAFSAMLLACSCMGAASQASGASLSEVYAQALENDMQLRGARSAYLAGNEAATIARAGLLPKIALEAAWIRSRADTRTTPSNPFATTGQSITESNAPGYNITLSQPLFDLAALHDYRRGQVQVDLATLQLESERQALILRVADAYLQTITAGAKYAAARSAEDALRLQWKAAKLKYDMGMARISAYLEAQAALDGATADTVVASNRLKTAFDGVRAITGLPLAELSALPDDFAATPPAPLAYAPWRDAALGNNVELRIAARKVDAARQLALSRGAEHLPTVAASLRYSDGYDRRNYDIALPDKQIKRGASIALTVSIPLYNGGAVSAAAREAGYLHQGQRDQRDGTERSVLQKTHAAYLNVISGVAALSARKAAVVSGQSALEYAHRGYDEGVNDMFKVLDAEKNLVQARHNYADALYSYLIAGLSLKQQTGALRDSDVAELDLHLDRARPVLDAQ
jgi:outer membrane protein